MTNNQCLLPLRVGVEGELILKNSLAPKILEHSTAFFLTFPFFCLSQDRIYTEVEHTCEIKTHSPTSDMGDYFAMMAKFRM